MNLPKISEYHAHVYFDGETVNQATALCEQTCQRFSIPMGRVHCRPVGPHSAWSCLLMFAPGQLVQVLPWLTFKREGLTVFIHPVTGDDLADHTKHVIWLGESKSLDVSQFL